MVNLEGRAAEKHEDNKREMQHGSWQKTINGDIEKDIVN